MQARTFMLDGDSLDIISAPTRLPREGDEHATVIGISSWRREAGRA